MDVALTWVKKAPRGVTGDAILQSNAMADADIQVIIAVLGGDVDRYAELVDRYQTPAYHLAYSLLGHAEDARDASQEAFLRAYQSLAQFRRQAKFSTWLYRIVVNKCMDMARQHAKRIRPQLVAGDEPGEDGSWFLDVPDPAAGPGERTMNRELARRLSQAIATLPMQQRTACALHYLQGCSLAEAAGIMRCRLGTVKSHLFRATARLRTQLGPWLKEEA